MKEINTPGIEQLENDVRLILQESVSDEYVNCILDNYDHETQQTFIESVIQDMIDTSAWKDEGIYSDSDIRYAIGREFVSRMGIEY